MLNPITVCQFNDIPNINIIITTACHIYLGFKYLSNFSNKLYFANKNPYIIQGIYKNILFKSDFIHLNSLLNLAIPNKLAKVAKINYGITKSLTHLPLKHFFINGIVSIAKT